MSDKYKDAVDQCNSCKFCVYKDYGYSNWTVEGTEKLCARNIHQPFDNGWGEVVSWAVVPVPCSGFQYGKPIDMDVDMEAFNALTDEQKDIYNAI